MGNTGRGKKVEIVVAVMMMLGASMLITEYGTNKIAGTEVREDYQALEEKKEYTVLLYMNGSDLETEDNAASEDLEEISNIIEEMYREKEMNFHMAAETGGSEKWEEQSRFQITSGGVRHLEKTKPKNMGEAGTLADFLNYGILSYPADKYILVCWNHGNGPIEGFGNDEVFDGDSLCLEEMKEAFDSSKMKEYDFELVGFDACLMGSVETVYMMPENVKYMAASPELEPEEGWDYTWLNILDERGVTGQEIGRRIGETYLQSQEGTKLPISLTVADVKGVKEQCRKWNEKLEKEKWTEKQIETLLNDRENIEEYCTDTDSLLGGELVGCETLMQSLCEAWDIEEEFLKGVTEKFGNEEAQLKESTLSIYFPEQTPEEKEFQLYESFGFLDGYYKMLEHIFEYMDERVNSYEKEGVLQGKEIKAALSPEQFQAASHAVQVTYMKREDGEHYIISTDSDVTMNVMDHTLSAVVPAEYMGLQGEIFAAIEEAVVQTEEEDVVYVQSPVLYEEEMGYLKVKFSEEYPSGEVLGIVMLAEDGKSSKKMCSIEEGDQITPLYPKEKWETEKGIERFVQGKTVTVEWDYEERCMQSLTVDEDCIGYKFLVN